ncbi:hypothetical protein FNF31_00266 [Cafeteria roenbergensis]|uniref:Uncharacterized protein n=1 Tax=Cafeteria roenbergensis TaxID=33653 RepID=A0A5A8DUP8_CAFRO|nr:hypothetical protein FNF31_00266 [Cafeteria roenbergensis]
MVSPSAGTITQMLSLDHPFWIVVAAVVLTLAVSYWRAIQTQFDIKLLAFRARREDEVPPVFFAGDPVLFEISAGDADVKGNVELLQMSPDGSFSLKKTFRGSPTRTRMSTPVMVVPGRYRLQVVWRPSAARERRALEPGEDAAEPEYLRITDEDQMTFGERVMRSLAWVVRWVSPSTADKLEPKQRPVTPSCTCDFFVHAPPLRAGARTAVDSSLEVLKLEDNGKTRSDVFKNLKWDEFPLQVHPSAGKALVLPCGEGILVDVQCSPHLSNTEGRPRGFKSAVVLRWCGDDASEPETWQAAIKQGRSRNVTKDHDAEGGPLLEFGTEGGMFASAVPTVSRPGRWQLGFVVQLLSGWEPIATNPIIVLAPEIGLDSGPTTESLSKANQVWWGQPLRFQALTSESNAGDRVVLVRQTEAAWRSSSARAPTPLRAALSYTGADHHRVSKEALASVAFPTSELGCAEFEVAADARREDLSRVVLPADPAPLSLGRKRLSLTLSGAAAATQPGHYLAFYLRYDAMRKGPCTSTSRLVVGKKVILSDAPSSIVYPACMDALVASSMLEARGPRIFAADTRGIYVQDDRQLWPEKSASETATSVIGPLHALLCDGVVSVPWGAAVTACFKASPLASKSDSVKVWRISHPGSAVSASGRIFAAMGPTAPKSSDSLAEEPGTGMCALQVALASSAQALGHSRFVPLGLPFPGLFRLSYCIDDRGRAAVVEHSAPCVALGPSLLPLVDSAVVSAAVGDSTSARGTSVPIGRLIPANAASWLAASSEAPAPLVVKRALQFRASGAPAGGAAGSGAPAEPWSVDEPASAAAAASTAAAGAARAAASGMEAQSQTSASLVAADVGPALICRTARQDLVPEPFFGEGVKVRWRASCWRSARDFVALVPLGQDVSSPQAIRLPLPAPSPVSDMDLRSTIASSLAATGCVVGETPRLQVLAQIDNAWWEHGDLTFADEQAPKLPGEWQFVYVCHPAGSAAGGPAEAARSLPFNVRPPVLDLYLPGAGASADAARDADKGAAAVAPAPSVAPVACPARLDVRYTTRPLPAAGWFGSKRNEYIGVARDGEAPRAGASTHCYKAVPSEGSGVLSFGPSELPNERGQYQMVYFKQTWVGGLTVVSRSSVKFSMEPSADQSSLELRLLSDACPRSVVSLRRGPDSGSDHGRSPELVRDVHRSSPELVRGVHRSSPDGSVASALQEDASLDDSASVVSRHSRAQPLPHTTRPASPPALAVGHFDTSGLDSVVRGTRALRAEPFAVAKAREWMRLGSTATEVMEQLVASGVSHQEAQEAVGALARAAAQREKRVAEDGPQVTSPSEPADDGHGSGQAASPSPGPLSMIEQVALRAKARQERVDAAAVAAEATSGAASASAAGTGAGGAAFREQAAPAPGGPSGSTRPLTLTAQRAQSIELGLSSLKRSVPAYGSASGGAADRARSLISALESFSLGELGGQEGIAMIIKVLPSPSESAAIASTGLSTESNGGLGEEGRALLEALGGHSRCLTDVAQLCELAMSIPEAAEELAAAAEANAAAATVLSGSRGLREFLAALGASLSAEHGSGSLDDEEAGRNWVSGFSMSALPPASKIAKVLLSLGPDALEQPPEARCSDSPVYWYVSAQPALRTRRSISQADDLALARMKTAMTNAAKLSARIVASGLPAAAEAARAVESAATKAAASLSQALDAFKALSPAGSGAAVLEGMRALALSVLPAAVRKARSDASRGQASAAAAASSPAASSAASAQTPAIPLSVSQMNVGLKAALDARRMAMRGRGADHDSDDGWSSDDSLDT